MILSRRFHETSKARTRTTPFLCFSSPNLDQICFKIHSPLYATKIRRGLEVRPGLHGRKVPGSRSAVYTDLLHVKSYVEDQTLSRWCGMEVWREGAISGIVLVI
ncbi:hypothetical protein AVEN_131535-1 [Araneus ventricosus]|uniref:Uncharacterized protein n=1 Tax=Araneus ventricosus TaxID=182803 RepID=A0A4Y2M0U0_ARAVE|nr:hypothetical protein AVEN_131535-1 [Araneus ventricosus]